jgi:hypothetical protein
MPPIPCCPEDFRVLATRPAPRMFYDYADGVPPFSSVRRPGFCDRRMPALEIRNSLHDKTD